MDRMSACEAGDPGSIPGESTVKLFRILNILVVFPRRVLHVPLRAGVV